MNDSSETLDECIKDKQDLSQEHCYLLAVKVVKDQLITWPESADSKLWNERVNSLLSRLCVEFGFDGENE